FRRHATHVPVATSVETSAEIDSASPGVGPAINGHIRAMPATLTTRRLRPLVPLAAVSAAAVGFAVLLLLVRTQWPPLESADRGIASDLNGLVSGHHLVVTVIKAVTWLGSDGVLWTVTISAALVLAIRQRWRLSAYLLVTGAGALVLDPVLKSLVGRLRP